MNFVTLRIAGISVIAIAALLISALGGEGGLSPEEAVLGGAFGIAVFIGMLTIMEFGQTVVDNTSKNRVVSATLRRAEAFRKMASETDKESARRDEGLKEIQAFFLRSKNKKNLDKIAEIRKKLMQAGYRTPNAITIYAIAKLAMPFLGIFIGYYIGNNMYPGDLTRIMLFVAVGGFFGSMAVDMQIKGKIKERLGKIEEEFPSYLELLLICVRSGMSIDRAVDQVNHEIALNGEKNIILNEFDLFSIDLKTLSDRIKAYDNLEKRAPTESLNAFCMMMVQSERYGTPIAKSMQDLASDVRRQTLIRAEQKAAKLPVVMLFPMVLFIVFPLLALIMTPAGIALVDTLR